ncbi:MAG: RNA methyltransferase, partial [Pseudomonadota bacterium]
MVDLLTIESLGAQGDGVTADGVFVPGALPGEVVRANLHGHRAELIEVLEPSADRRQPECASHGRCGCCTLQ